jgi:outer membrane protein insertion porin family
MIKKLITISILIVFFSGISKAEVIKNIIIEGNKRVSEETIKVYGNFNLNQDISENQVNQILNNLYETEFFENIEIEFKNNILKIVLKEHPIINQLILFGEPKKAFQKEIKKLIKSKEKKPFIKSFINNDIEIIKRLYSSLGYNFANIDVKMRQIDNESLDLVINIDRGKKTKISNISFIGNQKVRSNRLKQVIASEEDKFWKFLSRNTNFNNEILNLNERLLINYYKSIGYYDIKVKSNVAEVNKDNNVNLIYSIDEGKRYFFNKISTKVDSVLSKELFFPLEGIYREYAGGYYSPFKIKKMLEEIDLIIDNNDLQFVEHSVQEEIKDDSIDIIFNIYEGKKDLVEKINITGNNVTNEDVIRSELIIDEGDPYIDLHLEKSIAKIRARGIFKKVKYNVEDGSKNNLKIINIKVEEGATGEISAGAGIGTSGGTIIFNLQENNWMGEGKTVGFEADIDEESFKGRLNYSNPNYNFLGNSLNYYFSNESNDKPDLGYENSVISTGVGTSFEQYRDTRVRLGMSASYDDLKTDSSASSALQKQSGTFGEVAANYSFTVDKRDRVFMPTNGQVFSFSQEIPVVADKSFIANTLSSSFYKSFSENIVGASKIYLSSINGLGDDDVRLSKRKGIYQKRLRGFKKNKIGPIDGSDHVGGNYVAALNLETNLPNFLPENSNADLSLFLDFANVWGVDYSDEVDDSSKLRSSTGVAANWLSPIGPISFVFSQNLSKADSDETESFSFNLGTTF